jgi:hypothetical protein
VKRTAVDLEDNSGKIQNVTSLEIRHENQVSAFCLRSGNYTGICISRSVPEGVKQWEFEYPFTEFKVMQDTKRNMLKNITILLRFLN